MPGGWTASQSHIAQWGGMNAEWDHFSAFRCGWFKYNQKSWWLLSGLAPGSVRLGNSWTAWSWRSFPFKTILWCFCRAAVRCHGAVGAVTSFFLFLIILPKWAFEGCDSTQEVGMRQCLQVQCFSYNVLFFSVIFWHLAGEVEGFCRQKTCGGLQLAAGSRSSVWGRSLTQCVCCSGSSREDVRVTGSWRRGLVRWEPSCHAGN